MGIFDKFKTSKKQKDKDSSKKIEKEENVLDMVKDGADARTEKTEKKDVKLKESTGLAYSILERPQITEKATMLASSNKYVFRVNPRSNKNEVKKAIEKVYDVKVLKVNIINTFGKNRRYGQTMGRTKDWKKAVITVAKGQRIEGVTATEQA